MPLLPAVSEGAMNWSVYYTGYTRYKPQYVIVVLMRDAVTVHPLKGLMWVSFQFQDRTAR